MAKPGRKPKPAELRIIEGNREHRPIPDIPKIQAIYPEPPPWIRGVSRREWKRAVPALAKVGLLTVLDIPMFEAYCVAYGAWQQEVKENGRGQWARLRDLKTIAAEFGMTPSARTRVDFIKQHESKDEDLD